MDEPGKVMQFISEKQIEEIRKTRGDKVEDETVTVYRPLCEVLQEAKDKKQAEFEEKYLKHRPPKALDDDESDFLEALEQQKKEKDKEQAEEEARELTNFQMALASRTVYAYDDTRKPAGGHQDQAKREAATTKAKRPAFQAKILPKICVLPVAKKPKVKVNTKEDGNKETKDAPGPTRVESSHEIKNPKSGGLGGLAGLMSYGSDVDDDEDDDDNGGGNDDQAMR